MPDEITLTSTTATQEEINQALGIAEPDPAQPEPKPEKAEDGKQTQPEQQEGDHQQKEQGRRKPKSAQDRINELTREKYELREKLARLEGTQSRGEDKSATQAKPAEPAVAPTRPKPDKNDPKYQDYDQYMEDLADWKAEQRIATEKAQEAERQKTERLRESYDQYRARLAETAAKHDDWDEVMGNENIKLPQVLNVAIPSFDNGPEMLYHIATNDEFRQKLNDMNDGFSDLKIVHELSRLSDYLLEQGEKASDLAQAEPSKSAAPVAAPKPAVSKAPEPIKPVSGASTAANGMKSPDEMSLSEYKRWRRENT